MMVDDLDVNSLLTTLENNVRQLIVSRQLTNPLMVGIRTGGVWIAELLHQRLAMQQPMGLLDISFYRDDFSQAGLHPNVKPSQLPADIEGQDIILVDDVFYTGRTARAALNEIFDYGRPKQVVLVVLIERNGKQIPLSPDCVGASITLAAGQRIKFTGPDPMNIVIQNMEEVV